MPSLSGTPYQRFLVASLYLRSFQDVPDQVSLVWDGLCYCSFKANLASAWLRDRPKIRIHTLVPLPNMDFEAWKHRRRVQVTGFSGWTACSFNHLWFILFRWASSLQTNSFLSLLSSRGPKLRRVPLWQVRCWGCADIGLGSLVDNEDSIKYCTSQYTWHLFRCVEGTNTRINVLLCFCMCFYQSDWFPYLWYLLFSSRTL